MAIEIPLNRGFVALVDDEDAHLLAYTWTLRKCSATTTYAVRPVGGSGEKRRSVYMHREIMKPQATVVVDHRDGNGLNNQRSNLRCVPRRDNITNSVKRRVGSSIYKGVTLKNGRFWYAVIRDPAGAIKYFGHFSDQIDAARAFDEVARQQHGEFGTYNFPFPGERSALTGLIEPFPNSEAA